MSFTIAVAGKGGVGKTAISALIVRGLAARGLRPVLAVDADANVNLNEALGVEVAETIGSVREEMLREVRELPAGISKESFVEMKIEESLIEEDDFDLLVMGRPEGPGCYCYANNILRRYIDILGRRYPYTVIDNEAGMEHLSRRTTQNVDLMLVVSDASPVGLKTAGRIWLLARDLNLNIAEARLVINRASGLAPADAESLAALAGIPLGAVIPTDEALVEHVRTGRPLFELDGDTSIVIGVSEIIDRYIVGATRRLERKGS